MLKYSKVSIKLPDSQLNILKTAVTNQADLTSRMKIKIFNEKELPHELSLTRRQKRKLRNALENNMSTDTKLSNTRILKIIQSGGFLETLLSKIAGPLIKAAVLLAKNILASLGITTAESIIDAGI